MRLLSQFRRAYKRSDKAVCLSSSLFLAHLVNQKVAGELVALQILTLLLERPTDDSVETAVGFMKQVGSYLASEATKTCNVVFERFRGILHEGGIEKRTQYMVEVLFQVRKEKFNGFEAVPEGLDLVEEEDLITHMVGLTDELLTEDMLNVFQFDADFLESEQKYEYMKREILGEESDDSESDGSGDGSDEDEEEGEEELEEKRKVQIHDQTNTNVTNLRRAIYLTIMSSLNFEECAHKLMKLDVQSGQEIELSNMVIECCSQEPTYVNFYGLLGERFCRISPNWQSSFVVAYEETFKTIHRFETNRLRNIAKFFSHLLSTDAMTWEVFSLVHLSEASTTSSSRIFLKILFTELTSALGLKRLKDRLNDKEMVVSVETNGGIITRGVFDGLFPMKEGRDTRFAVNYFTSIGLGALTEDMRLFLTTSKAAQAAEESSSEDSSDSSDSSDSDSEKSRGSQSRDRNIGRKVERSRSEDRLQRSTSREKVSRSISRDRKQSRTLKGSRDSRSPSRDRKSTSKVSRSRSRSRDRSRERPRRRYRSKTRSRSRDRRTSRERSRSRDRRTLRQRSRSVDRTRRRDDTRDRDRGLKRDRRDSRSPERTVKKVEQSGSIHPSRMAIVPQ